MWGCKQLKGETHFSVVFGIILLQLSLVGWIPVLITMPNIIELLLTVVTMEIDTVRRWWNNIRKRNGEAGGHF